MNLCGDLPLAAQRDNSPVVPISIYLFLDIGREGNSTHDTIPELLIEDSLISISIVLHNLIKTVDQRLLGRHLNRLAAIGETAELHLQLRVVNHEQVGQLVDVLCRSLGLAVEYGCGGYLIAADVFGDLLEAQSLAGLGVEQGLRCCGEVGVLGVLVEVSAGSGEGNWKRYIESGERHGDGGGRDQIVG